MTGNFAFKKFDNVYIGYIPDSDIQRFADSLGGSYLYIGIPEISMYLRNYQMIEGKNRLPILLKETN